MGLNELLSLEEALKMAHLPQSRKKQHDGLSYRPVKNPFVGALACSSESFLAELQHEQRIVL